MQNETQAPKNRLPFILTALVLAGAAVALGLHFLGGPAAAGGRPAPSVPVSAAPVKEGRLGVYIDAIGTVTPVSTVTVTSRVAGELTEVDYTEGQMVKRGDLLAVVDPRPYQAALDQAAGQLERDQATLRNAQIDLARYDDAFRQHAIPEQQYATQKATVDADAGVVRLDEGNLAAAQVNVDYSRITSPIDGRVGLRQIDAGNIIQANGTVPLTTITQIEPITVIFTISEDRLADVLPGLGRAEPMKVLALDRSQQRKLGTGVLLTLDNQIDPTTGTVRARALFPNKDGALFPSQFVNARLLIRTLDKAILVPSSAVQLNDDKRFAYVVGEDGVVQLRPIKVVATEGEVSAVTGVKVGENVVTDGFDRLQNGLKVSIRQNGAP